MSKFSPTHAELALVTQIFNKVDSQKLGILTGDVAVKVFGGAKLQPTVLREIWTIADEDNNGWLSRKGVSIALRLIGWAQKGESITPDLVFKPGPIADIEGYSAVAQHSTGTPLAKSPPPTLPVLTAQEKVKFVNLFNKSGPDANGLLSGNKARDVFVKSKLSNDLLLQIWNLADTQDRGALDATDFTIGMYFIQALMSGQLTFVPTSLPPGFYQQAGGSPASNQGSIRSHMTGNSGSFSPLSGVFPPTRGNIQPQYTGQSQLLQPNHTGFSSTSANAPALPARPTPPVAVSSPFLPQRNGALQWDVTPDDKAAADKYFDELDTAHRGFIEGDVAVPFLLKSNLGGDVLARVWDLADVNNDGRLTRDGFAIAMYLIQKKLRGVEIPTSLPPTLVPPSMRSAPTSVFANAQRQEPLQEPARDLLWDDTPPASATVPPPARPSETLPPSQSRSVSAPAFVEQDPFGASFSTPNRDLLGDDDEVATVHPSPPLQDRSAEIGNTQNQLHSTNRALDTLKNERAQTDEQLASQTSQLEDLRTQLANAKASYETETKTLANIRERYAAQAVELKSITEEHIRATSDLSAIRLEKSEVEGSYMRDKEEVRELQRKMADINQLIEATKAEVEKAKKDAKQQKGLLAIAKKQLSAKEAEKLKAEKELEEAAAEVAAITKERQDAEAELDAFTTAPPVPVRADSTSFAASHPLPASPDLGSPTPSIIGGKSNNPFDKLQKSGDTPRSQSPYLPFAAGSPPMPSTDDTTTAAEAVNQASSYDPFGFSEAFETSAPPSNGDAAQHADLHIASGTSTPKPAAVDVLTANLAAPQSVLSAGTEGESDHFVTPPTSATQTRSPSLSPAVPDAASKFPALDDVVSKFPNIDSQDATITTHAEDQTDLGSGLKELDVEESDSDSEDEIPLADLASKAKGSPKALANQGPVLPSEQPSFDDVFGVSPPTSVQSQPETAKAEQPSSVAGVSAFDEAMGTIPASANADKPAFTFDSAFDDNFDFASATSKPFPPPATASGALTGGASNIQAFDSIFTPTTVDATTFPPPPAPQASSTNGHAMGSPTAPTPKPTFDEAFLGFDSNPSMNLSESLSIPAPAPKAASVSPVTTFPSAVSTTPPRVKPTSPPRQKSPPPRSFAAEEVSPKRPRTSTSSKETHEKIKEPTSTRHSKLSIRLPFGKKKKQQAEALPSSPAPHLTPSREEPTRSLTPAVDGDVEAVKQLSAMGFSRSEAIGALEKYDYDVQRALNSLLGAP
ncbi:hypothetical protein H0H92_000676 [Tricholoma furcatifolium]|nr:hypothetical protein H0H92_000676 [Tricholoma furcatifolium]